MSRSSFIVLVVGVMLVGGGIGWWLGRPTPLQPVLHAHLTPYDPNNPDPSPPPTGSDQAPGWQNRQALRAAAATALDQLEPSPCDPTARKAFFEAYANMLDVRVTDSNDSSDENGPSYWHSDEDQALDKRVLALQSANYITTEEIAYLLFQRRLGAGAVPTRAPTQVDRCGFTASSLD